jgi:hypothetical protein
MKFLIIIFIFFTTMNYAFTLNNNASLAFSQNPVKVNVASGFCSNIGVDENELLSMAQEAVLQYWNKAPTSRLKLRSGSLQSVSTNFKTGLICLTGTNCDPNPALVVDSGILISCNTNTTNFSTNAVLAVTVPNNISGSVIDGSLIILNDTATNNQLAQKSRDEFVAILAHEIGHAIGLGHSPVRDSLMYYSVIPNRRSLGVDDIDGVTYLYPKQQPVACGTIKDLSKKDPGISFFMGPMIMAIFYLLYLKLRPRFSHSRS